MSAGRPRCAVIIPAHDQAMLTRLCLQALVGQESLSCERTIVVVDDASSDDTAKVLDDYAGSVQVVSRPTNGGFAQACNDGAAAAGDCDHLVFLNNDTLPVAGWLDALVAEVQAHPEAGAVGAKLLFPDGTVQHAGVAISQDGWPRHLYTNFPEDHPAVNRSKRVAAATAACLLVRRSDFAACGGFDTAFLNGYEDVDLCLRLGQRGREVRYCAESVVYHLESATRAPDEKPLETVHNDALYTERWRGKVPPDDIDHYIADGLLSLAYDAYFPARLTVSPYLATICRDDGQVEGLERILERRSRQVMDLLRAQTRNALRAGRVPPPTAGRSTENARAAAEIIGVGETYRLGVGRPRHLVSVLLPVKNAGPGLRETLASVLRQSASTLLEIVAIDSGSDDGSIATLNEFGATVVAIDPADFDHGLTRNLAAQHARGDVLVFLNQRSLPADDAWLEPLISSLDHDPYVAGVCSRVIPHPEADVLSARDVRRDPSGSEAYSRKQITDWRSYQSMPPQTRRELLNFHTASAAIRADVFARIKFRSVRTLGEDLLWSREVVESGLALVHEPASRCFHSHNYPLADLLGRNFDDGLANREIVGRELHATEVVPLIEALVRDDWAYLRDTLGLRGEELDRWQIEAALRRGAQVTGQWLGANADLLPEAVLPALSLTARVRGGLRRAVL